MKLGVFTQYVKADTVEELALRIKELDLQSVVLDTFPGLAINPENPDPAHCERIKCAFAAAGVEIAAIGYYVNFVHPDKEAREKIGREFRGMIRLAKEVGAPMICSEAGTYHPNFEWDPANMTEEVFELAVDMIRPHVEYAKALGVNVCLEPYVISMAYSAERLARLIRKLGEENVKAVLDPAGLLTRTTFDSQGELLADALGHLTPHIGLVHVQDCAPAPNWKDHFEWLGAGLGRIDYGLFMDHVAASGYDGPLIMEFLSEERIPESAAYVRKHVELAKQKTEGVM